MPQSVFLVSFSGKNLGFQRGLTFFVRIVATLHATVLLLQPKKYVVKEFLCELTEIYIFQSNFVRVIVHRIPALHPTLLPKHNSTA